MHNVEHLNELKENPNYGLSSLQILEQEVLILAKKLLKTVKTRRRVKMLV